LLLLDRVQLAGDVSMMKTQCASGKLIEHGVCVEPCLAGDLPYPFATDFELCGGSFCLGN